MVCAERRRLKWNDTIAPRNAQFDRLVIEPNGRPMSLVYLPFHRPGAG